MIASQQHCLAAAQTQSWLSLRNRDDREMTCLQEYSRLLEALAKNYPASGLVSPDYAATELTALLSQSRLLAVPDSQGMQQGFPELFAVLEKRRWERIPESWKPFLSQLAQRACRPQSCPQVTCVKPCMLSHSTAWLPSYNHLRLCRFQTMLSARTLLMGTASCQRTHYADPYPSLLQTRADALKGSLATSSTKTTLGSRLACLPCFVG